MGFSSRRITLMVHFLFSLVCESTLVPMESRNSVHRMRKLAVLVLIFQQGPEVPMSLTLPTKLGDVWQVYRSGTPGLRTCNFAMECRQPKNRHAVRFMVLVVSVCLDLTRAMVLLRIYLNFLSGKPRQRL